MVKPITEVLADAVARQTVCEEDIAAVGLTTHVEKCSRCNSSCVVCGSSLEDMWCIENHLPYARVELGRMEDKLRTFREGIIRMLAWKNRRDGGIAKHIEWAARDLSPTTKVD
jgi:hypothetical protein